jgi:hypothetical protein
MLALPYPDFFRFVAPTPVRSCDLRCVNRILSLYRAKVQNYFFAFPTVHCPIRSSGGEKSEKAEKQREIGRIRVIFSCVAGENIC